MRRVPKILHALGRWMRRYAPRSFLFLLSFSRLSPVERVTALLAYLTIVVLGSTFVIALDYKDHERNFLHNSLFFQQYFENYLRQNDLILSSLATLFESTHVEPWEKVREYAWKVLRRYPQIRTLHYYQGEHYETKLQMKPMPQVLRLAFIEPLGNAKVLAPHYDLLQYKETQQAAQLAALQDFPVPTSIFELETGVPIYLLFQSVYNANSRQVLGAKIEGLVGLSVDVREMFRHFESDLADLNFELYYDQEEYPHVSAYKERWPLQQQKIQKTWQRYTFKTSFKSSIPSQVLIVDVSWQPKIPMRTWMFLLLLWIFPAFLLIFLLLGIIRRRQAQRIFQRRESQLSEDRSLAHMTLSALEEGVLVFDASHQLRYANKAARRLIDKHAVWTNRDVFAHLNVKYVPENHALLPPSPEVAAILSELPELPPSSSLLKYFIERGVAMEFGEPFVLVNRFDVILPLEGRLSPVYNDKNFRVGNILVVRNMSNLRRRVYEALEKSMQQIREHEAQLAHAARLHSMGELASGIAHEINQPLAAILSYNQAALLLLEDGDEAALQHALNASVVQAQRAGNIIQRLRAFVNKHEAICEPIHLNIILENMFAISQVQLNSASITTTKNFAEDLPEILGDRIQIEQIVVNLISNAVDAVSTKAPYGTIELSTGFDKDHVWLSIRDNGGGVPDHVREKIFDPFFTTKKSKGMGLGLSICRNLAQSRGGSLQQKNEGEGACFILTLPRQMPAQTWL